MPKNNFPVPKKERKGSHWKQLNTVIDPELDIGIVDLGLVYDVIIDKKGLATVKMTFTSPACPVGPVLVMQVEDVMRTIKSIKDVKVDVVWDPMWNGDMVDEDIRDMLMGII